jgi:hypothetical protein
MDKRRSIIKSALWFVWEVAKGVMNSPEAIYISVVLALCLLLRHIAHGNALIDRYIWCLILIAVAATIYLKSRVERREATRSQPTFPRSNKFNNSFDRAAIALCLAIATIIFLVQHASPPDANPDQPFVPTPPSDIQRMFSDPKVQEGMKIFKTWSQKHDPTTTRATTTTSP